MGNLSTGGGSSAVAASAHAGCERFRHTDPLVIGIGRRSLASQLGNPDSSAGIPEARWMRAMTFEHLVKDEKFVSELLTTAVGALRLARPKAVRRANGKTQVPVTAQALTQAHLKAVHEQVATMITALAVPFVGMEQVAGATPVKPDFAIVTPRFPLSGGTEAGGEGPVVGSWLIMGDAKDYERVRSRIDDGRMLKGFLQIALGAESVAAWSALPAGMTVHRWGALAVPRNSFLQPEPVVECLDDHRAEVMGRVAERTALLEAKEVAGSPIPVDGAELSEFVAHLEMTFDPATCTSCALFNHCRSQVRASPQPVARLIELGVRPELRPALIGLVDGTGILGQAPESLVAAVRATVEGLPVSTGQRRVDPVGLPGTINVVLAKSDAAALGVHGLGIQRVLADGQVGPWDLHVFDDAQSPATRSKVMRVLGEALDAAMADQEQAAFPGMADPVHLVVPDSVTGDVLASMADSLAGVEISRLRWAQDLAAGRKPLTFDGRPANVPDPLTDHQRLAVSFLLDQDRARAMSLRWPLLDLRAVLARHFVPGGVLSDAGRLDYLVTWAEAGAPLDHRSVSDVVAGSDHTPGARLSNAMSDQVHRASRRARTGADPAAYESLVLAELGYKADVVDRARAVLDRLPVSALREVYRALEADAQVIWRRRLMLHANDLVRFGRVSWVWRNAQVDLMDGDQKCSRQLTCLGNPQAAHDLARNAGTREVAYATVMSLDPVRIEVSSRRIKDTSHVVVLQVGEDSVLEQPSTTVKIQKGSFKFGGLPIGTLVADDATAHGSGLLWQPKKLPFVAAVGERVIIADQDWFGDHLRSGHEISVSRPAADSNSAPKSACIQGGYAAEPAAHQWCCRPHEIAEAEFADLLADRRAKGELNPQAWPPVVDEDQFDTPAAGTPTGEEPPEAPLTGAAELTMDDLD